MVVSRDMKAPFVVKVRLFFRNHSFIYTDGSKIVENHCKHKKLNKVKVYHDLCLLNFGSFYFKSLIQNA